MFTCVLVPSGHLLLMGMCCRLRPQVTTGASSSWGCQASSGASTLTSLTSREATLLASPFKPQTWKKVPWGPPAPEWA